MAGKPKWAIGQTVTVVRQDRLFSRKPDEITTAKVAKVGRKWVAIDDFAYNPSRFDAETGSFDGRGYYDSRKAYASLDEYEAEKGLANAWEQLRIHADSLKPPKFSTMPP